MHRFVVLVAFGVASVMALDKECMKLGHPGVLRCCKMTPPAPVKDDAVRECFEQVGPPKSPPAAPSCELELCIAKKKGYADESGKVDKKALEADVTEKFKDNPKLLEKIVENCVNGDLKDYGPDAFCDLMKIGHCVNMQAALSCPEYNDGAHCSEVKTLVEKCSA